MTDTIPNFEIPVQEFILTKEMLESGKNVYIPKGVNITDEALVVAVERGIVKPTKKQLELVESFKKEAELQEQENKKKYELEFILNKLGLDKKQVQILFENFK
jgi:hypothetical protein